MKLTTIYGLIDPRNGELRYIGKSHKLRERFLEHLSGKGKTHKDKWIRQLLSLGLQPELIVIEETEDWVEAEKFYIAYFRSIGANLTNLTDGGEGIVGYKPTAEVIEKRRQGNLGKKRSEATKLKVGLAKLGNQYSLGRKVSPDTRRKISEGNKGKTYSQEYKDNMSLKLRERGTPTWAVETNTKNYLVTDKEGNTSEVRNLRLWAEDKGFDPSHAYKVVRGKIKTVHGYSIALVA